MKGEIFITNEEKFKALCRERITRPGIDGLMEWLDTTDFYRAPASTRFHGDYEGGLVEHSLNVYSELQRLIKAYPEVNISQESAAITALFHDLCKVNMYATEKRNRKNELGQWEQYDFYTIKEQFCFCGHGSKSVYLAQRFLPLTKEEAAAINCHMGAWDGTTYMSGAYEQFPLAWLVHVADEAATYMLEGK